MQGLRVGVVLVLVVAAAVAANVALLSLSSDRSERVGRLTPIADVGATETTAPAGSLQKPSASPGREPGRDVDDD